MKLILAAIILILLAGIAAAGENEEKIYQVSLHYIGDQLYMTLNTIEVMSGPPSRMPAGDWYYELIDKDQRVLENATFGFTVAPCSGFVDDTGAWNNGCDGIEETDLVLEIPYRKEATDLTVYDGQGFVRFGPYDVIGM